MTASFWHSSTQLIRLSCKCKLPYHIAFMWKCRLVCYLCRHEWLCVLCRPSLLIPPCNLLIYGNKNLITVLGIGVLGSLPLSTSSLLLLPSSSSPYIYNYHHSQHHHHHYYNHHYHRSHLIPLRLHHHCCNCHNYPSSPFLSSSPSSFLL